VKHFSAVPRSVVILSVEQIRLEWKYLVVANVLAYSALRVSYFSKLAKLAKLIE
jgi:hypothetical protein